MGQLPPYLFARIDEMKAEKIRSGVDVIDLGVGDPDLPTPHHIVESLCEAAQHVENHHYPSYAGMPQYRSAVADWYKTRFGVSLDPGKEVLALMGSKDGITHIGEAFVDPGDYVLAPSPGYPGYYTGTLFSEGRFMKCRSNGRINSFPSFRTFQRMSSNRQNSCSSTTRTTRPRQ